MPLKKIKCLCHFKKKRRNPVEFHKASAAETSGTHKVHRNLPEPQQVSSPEPSGTSRGICNGTLQNLTRYLHQNPPEPCPEPGVEAAPDRTGATLG